MLFVAYWVVLFLATHLQIPRPIQEEVAGLDKYIHAAAYFILAGLLVLWNGWPYRLTFSRLLTIALFIATYAVFDEWLQSKVNRFADVKDWVADIIGGFCALALAAVVQGVSRSASPAP